MSLASRNVQNTTMAGLCLLRVQIEKIQSMPATGSEDRPSAVVTARLKESAVLWGENGKQADSYSSTYRVEYTLVQRADNSWRISEALVLGS